ncbi:unnamed protein product [Rodentolepis nana]|uniref:Fibronectin type-III domain-containing protein n=1 Tax=Rodentolepis nana TaxID=102285 RepID=A0A0R3T4M2_RODNA|nr:unnamed protein product [Rodentolepis nana]
MSSAFQKLKLSRAWKAKQKYLQLMSASSGAQCSEITPTMPSWFYSLLLAMVQMQTKAQDVGKYKPMCTGIRLFKPNEARLTWIPPVVKNEEIPSFRVFYFHDGALLMTLTSENVLEIPINENDTMIRAIVRTVTKSEVWTDEYKEDPNECKFNSKRSDDTIFRAPELLHVHTRQK